ncbi:MAG: hypothetical protein M0P91_04690 [Sulfuricurvum sp.]|jgi:hypothetical protein|uniref:hypothetical protein n=1 Tax=Sulfuricurvum sp. TaxID=2025608 RepID=UPI0025F38868|nr:hypothetical protein [Sulfuricurvum sp.]MCK9372473.1 hypothetical protein [Sulfuricurvum sp.]
MQHVVSQLITKKEELLGELKFHKTKVQQLEEVINGIDISISVFDPEFDLKKIKPKRYTGNKHYFKHGESFTMILDTLRKAKAPLTTHEITIELMKKKKLDYENKELVSNIQRSLSGTLKKQADNKTIQKIGEDSYNGFQWVISA